MELVVEQQLLGDRLLVGIVVGGGALMDLRQPRALRAGDPLSREGRGVRLDQGADLVQVGQVGGVEGAHGGAATRLDLHQPLLGEQQQRLAYGRTG